MLYNLARAAAPENLSVTAKPKFIALRVDVPASSYPAWEKTTFVRYLNLTDANADTNRNKQMESYENFTRDDDELTAGSTYYYRAYFVDEFGNSSTLTSEQHTTWKVVQDGDTDATAPAVPDVPAISTITADLDGDGTIDIALRLTLDFNTGVAVKAFEVELQRSATLGGSYAAFGPRIHVPAEASGSTLYDFKANAAKFYKARARAISFNGTKSAYSALTTTGVQPLNYTTAIAATTPVAALKPKGILVTWAAITAANYAYTIVTRSPGGEVGRVKTNKFLDMGDVALAVGTSYTYTIQHVTNSGVVSSASTASNAVEFDLISAGDLQQQPDGNFFRNPAFRDGSSSGWALVSTSIVSRAAATVAGAPAEYVAKITANGNWNGPNGGSPADWFEVSGGEVFAGRFFAAADSLTGTGNVFMACGFQNASGDNVSAFASIATNAVTLDSAGTWQEVKGLMTAPALVNGLPTAKMFIYLQITNTLTAGSVYVAKPRLRRATDNDMLTLGAVQDDNTDQTAPAVPDVPAISTITADIDDDGTIDTALRLTLDFNTGVPVKYFEVELQRSATLGGSYAAFGPRIHVPAEAAGSTLYDFKANAAKFYKARARAVSFNGTKSAYSALTATGVQPGGYANAMPTVSWVTPSGNVQPIVSRPRRNVLRWVQIALATYPQAKEIVIYRHTANVSGSAVEIDTVPPTAKFYKDDDNEMVAGTTYYYWLKVRDRLNQVSASFSAVQSIAFRTGSAVASDADFDTTALAAPGSFTYTQDTNFDLNGDGAVDMVMKAAFAAVTNAVDYEVEISRCATVGGTYVVVGLGGITKSLEWWHICNVNWFYKARVRARNAYGQPGTWTSLSSAVQPAAKTGTFGVTPDSLTHISQDVGVGLLWTSTGSSPDFAFTRLYVGSTSTFGSATVMADVYSKDGNSFYHHTGAQLPGATDYYWAQNFDRSGNGSTVYGPDTSTGPQGIGTAMLQNGNVTTAKLSSTAVSDKMAAAAVNSVGSYAFLLNSSGSGVPAGSTLAASDLAFSSTNEQSGAGTVSGTWRAMAGVPDLAAGLFLRIS
jgi:hypothetical protein